MPRTFSRTGRPRHQDTLTPTEWEVLALVRDGLDNVAIAGRRNSSVETIRYHLRNIREKLGFHSRQALIAWPGRPLEAIHAPRAESNWRIREQIPLIAVPNARLHLGSDVVIEVTGYADPCPTIRGSFADANVNLLNYRTAPESRVYARVLREGTIRPGDIIAIEPPATTSAPPMLAAAGIRSMNQVAIAVSDLDRSIAFYRENLGAVFTRVEPAWGLAWLDIGGVALMLEGPTHNKEATPGTTTLYFNVEAIDASYEAMTARGVAFDAPPLMQWEENGSQGWMAFLRDPDGYRLGIVSRVDL